jgi:hypothetical protein
MAEVPEAFFGLANALFWLVRQPDFVILGVAA